MTLNSNRFCMTPSTTYEGPRRSLVLAGGGMRVAYQAGVIKALFEEGLCFNHTDATSGGIINQAMLLSGLSPDEMCSRWRSLNVSRFVSFLPFDEYLPLNKTKALGDADGIINYVFPHLGIDAEQLQKASGVEGTFNICNYDDKTVEVIPHQQAVPELLVAGISLPVFMPPVLYKGHQYIDAVWIKDANLMEAVKRGAEEIWLVWCIGNHGLYRDGVFNQYVHMIEMSANGVLFEEFDRINEINKRIEQGDSPYGQRQPITLHLIKPEYPLPLDTDLYFNHIDTSTLIAMGYSDARKYLKERNSVGIAFSPVATRMKDPVPGITFRKKMEGWFAFGESDPEAGARKGKKGKTKLTLHASVCIRHMKAFMKSKSHGGVLTGHLNFTDQDKTLPIETGTFNLFVEDDVSRNKQMLYKITFNSDGQSYALAGHKEIHDDPGFDLWKDTTTMRVQLFEGIETKESVIGA